MRILITGGLGFIGGRLAVHLKQAGHQVVLGSRNPISSLAWLPQAEVTQIKWDDDRSLESICTGVDVVVQAAGMNAQDCAIDPVAALAFNGVATARLVLAASRVGVKRFIYLSTAHVYASPLVGTITEETCPRNLHAYATSHLAGEYAVLNTCQNKQIQGVVLRLSNAFGSPMHKDVNCWMLLVNDLCKQAIQTRKLQLQSSGLQQRDFIGLTEVCRVVEHFSVGNVESMQSGIFNVGTGVSQTVFAMAQLVQERCKAILRFNPELVRPTSGASEQHQVLSYQSNYFSKIGLDSLSNNKIEIDTLLKFCESTFVSSS